MNTVHLRAFALLLSTALLITNPALSEQSSEAFTDTDGDEYRVVLTGPGGFNLARTDTGGGAGPVASITLTETTEKSVLKVTVTQQGNGDGVVEIGAISGEFSLKSISAGATRLGGAGIAINQGVGSIKLGDISGGAAILSGSNAKLPKLKLTAANVSAGARIEAPGQTLIFRATKVSGASITAEQIAQFEVTAGSLVADIAASGKVVALSVKGGDFTGHLAADSIGSIRVERNKAGIGGSITGSTITAKSIGAVLLDGNLTDSFVLAGASLGADFSLGGTGGSADQFAEGSLRTFMAKGNVTNSIVGAGFSPGNAAFGDLSDGVIGNGKASFIKSFTVRKALDAASLIGAAKFPKKVTVNGTKFAPTSNAQFISRAVVPPTDPVDLAPALDPTVAMPAVVATAFLYTGPNAIQTGVTEGTIEPARAAVLRGRVLRRDNTPLPGVMVTILDHPEFGRTHSRADGMFDIAVNGGGLLNVSFDAVGFIPAQRQVEVFSQDFCKVPDVALLILDPVMTPVTFGAATIQVHEATMQSDDDGQRRAVLVFHPGTTAMLHQADGSTAPLPLGSVRVTEFTVGDMGDEAMPALLPPNSAYTYCAALSVDEAANPGAAQVDFNQPVYLYVENFLDFPIGIDVPNGFFNRAKGVWEAEASGLVIKILSETGGAADLDVDGDAAADTGAELTGLGITDAERQQLAAKYATGQSLWRVPLMHFSTVDANWPGGPGGGAGPPNGGPPTTPPPPDNDDDPPGFFVQAQRSFERVPVAGTPFSLNYHSNRVNGYKPANRVVIPLSGASFPGAVQRINLEVSVGGRTFTQEFAPTTNLSTDFIWDGLDAYGRAVTGAQPAIVKVSNVYPGVYSSTRTFGTNGEFLLAGNPTRRETTISTTHKVMLGNFDIRRQSLGGWTLDAHHFYDPVQRRLYLGDGAVRSIGSVNNAVGSAVGSGEAFTAGFNNDGIPAAQARLVRPAFCITGADGTLYFSDAGLFQIFRVDPDGTQRVVAGIAQSAGYNGDERPALGAQVSFAFGLALAPDGTLFFVDAGNRRVRSITPDGMIHTVAGTGVSGYTGDGGPATAARINAPVNLMRSLDGTLFISDANNRVIRRVGTDGIISTVAGTGVAGFSGDGGPATAAQMIEPLGTALDADGNLYIADGTGRRIRRVGPDGIIRTFAGTGAMPPSPTDPAGDGGPATAAQIGFPNGISLDREGNLLIADGIARRIRKVSRTGIITSVAGTGAAPVAGAPNGDGGAALQAATLPTDVTVGPNGSIFFTEEGTRSIRQLIPPLPGFDGTDIALASEDGSELYRFDENGRHLATLDAFTGATLFTFEYDGDGQVVKLTDGSGNATTITRTAAGAPMAITGPDGRRTTLSVDANGSLAAIVDPAGGAWNFTYDAGGLLLTETTPTGDVHTLTYDANGRLTRHDPAGPLANSFERTDFEGGFSVMTTSALGANQTFEVRAESTGDTLSINTDAAGFTTSVRRAANAIDTTISPDGVIQTVTIGPSPRFGLQAPIDALETVALPSGRTRTIAVAQTATAANPQDPLGFSTLTETSTLNGKTTTTIYAAATRQLTATTPLGRTVAVTINALGLPEQIAVANFHPIRVTHDGRGRPMRFDVGPAGSERSTRVTYDASGLPASYSDALARQVGYGYDAAGRLQEITLTDGEKVGLNYDARGNVTSVVPPGRPAYLLAYSPTGKITSHTAPDAGSGAAATAYTYDADDRLTQITRPDGATIALSYDDADRLRRRTTAAGDTNFAYSAATGHLTSITTPEGNAMSLTYDGRLALSVIWSGEVAGAITRTIDNHFRTATQSVNGGPAMAFAYDDDGALATAGDFSITRSPQTGLPASTSLDALTDSRSFNAFGELASVAASHGGAPLYAAQYTRDSLGRITQIGETILGTASTFTFAYDAAGRLAEVKKDAATQATYSYDANNNRLTAGGTAATYDAQDRLVQLGAASFASTAAGERLTRTDAGQTTTYTHDAAGILRAVALPSGTLVEYIIDGAGRRIGRKVGGALVQGFLYENQIRVIAELDGASNVVSRFVYAERDHVPSYMIKAGTRYRLITDHLGSIRLVVNSATGAVAQRLDYDAFGRILADTSPGFQPFGFAGGLVDVETHLVRFGARDYDPESGRWLTRDPILFGGGSFNLYAYAGNDPVNAIDPTGLATLGDFLEALAGVGAQAATGVPGIGAAIKKLFEFPEDVGNAIDEINKGADEITEILKKWPKPKPKPKKKPPKCKTNDDPTPIPVPTLPPYPHIPPIPVPGNDPQPPIPTPPPPPTPPWEVEVWLGNQLTIQHVPPF